MKRTIAILLTLALLLCGCGKTAPAPETSAPTTQAAETVQVTEAPATEPTTEATEPPPVYRNPLNGEILAEPFTDRIFASTISNIPGALPHVGVNQADVLMEMYVNNSIIRCLALFSDIRQVPAFGSVRSLRLMFTDIAQHYDLIVGHASGSPTVLGDAEERGLEHTNLDQWSEDQYYSFRDKDRSRTLGLEHSLLGIGDGMYRRAEELGYATTRPADKSYGFVFTEDGTPAEGEDAQSVSVTFTFDSARKETVMVYDESLGKYVFNQYDKEMVDSADGEKEAFRNVLIMHTQIGSHRGNGALYQTADFLAGGDGYFACGGKLVPMQWSCESEDSPFEFWTQSGEPLELGVGNTYIAICTPESPVEWTGAETEAVG